MTPLRDRQETFARTLAVFFAWMLEQGYHWSLGDAWRSTDELLCSHCGTPVTYQDLLVSNGRSKVRASAHTERRAIDLILWVDGKLAVPDQYRPLAEKWELLGGRAGFRFGIDPKDYATKAGWDAGHFETV